MGINLHVTQSNHADGLPDTKADTRSDSPVQTLDTVGLVDVLEGLGDGQVLGPVGVILLALHLDANDLNWLVPGGQSTSQG